MTDKERIDKFFADFARLQKNREAVPLETLQGKFGAAYKKLCGEVQDGGDWFALQLLQSLAAGVPTHPKDPDGKAWAEKKIQTIIAEENKPGKLRDRWRAALIDRLDMDAYDKLVFDLYVRIRNEALFPYWRRHVREVKGWLYSDILKQWWLPKEKDPKGHGAWINRDWTGRNFRWSPISPEDW